MKIQLLWIASSKSEKTWKDVHALVFILHLEKWFLAGVSLITIVCVAKEIVFKLLNFYRTCSKYTCIYVWLCLCNTMIINTYKKNIFEDIGILVAYSKYFGEKVSGLFSSEIFFTHAFPSSSKFLERHWVCHHFYKYKLRCLRKKNVGNYWFKGPYTTFFKIWLMVDSI